MKEKVLEVLDMLDNSDLIKRLKELSVVINKNEEYNKLINNFLKNKIEYEKNNSLSEEIIRLRKKLFSIDELKEYLELQNDLRLLSININNIIMSILN